MRKNHDALGVDTRRIIEVHQSPDTIRILDGGRLVASHLILEGRRQYGSIPSIGREELPEPCGTDISTACRSVGVAITSRSAPWPSTKPSASGSPMGSGSGHDPYRSRHAATTLNRIKHSLVGLRMPRALEVLDATVRRIEQARSMGSPPSTRS